MKSRRKNYITNKRYQFRMLALLLLIVYVAIFGSVFATHYALLHSIMYFTEQEGRSPTGAELVVVPLRSLAIIVPIVFVVVSVITIFVSHRIAGPLQRLKLYMEKVGQGNFALRLRFRKYDEIHDVAESFNGMVKNLEKSWQNPRS